MTASKALKIVILLNILVWSETIKTESIKSLKFILYSFTAQVDTVYVKEFRQISPGDDIYDCVIIKEISALFIDVSINQIGKNREVYKLNNLDGCLFLANPLFSRVFYGFYKMLLVNRTAPTKCPIKAGSYLFRTAVNEKGLPQIHPKGNFSLNLKLKANSDDGVILDLKWLYRFVRA